MDSLMYKIRITDTNKNKCTFCKEEEETVYHLIWKCPIVRRFLEQLHNMLVLKDIKKNQMMKLLFLDKLIRTNSQIYLIVC